VTLWISSAPSTLPAKRKAPARHQRAADDDGQDGVQFHEEADIVGVGALDIRADDDPGDARRRGEQKI
jgi:hypothetical protein